MKRVSRTDRRPPSGGRAVVHAALRDKHYHAARLRGANKSGRPLPVYVVASMDAKRFVRSAKLVGWDYPVFSGSDLIGLARLRLRRRKWTFCGLIHGWLIDELAQVAASVEAAEASTEGIKLALLEVPRLSLTFLWVSTRWSDRFVDLRPPKQGSDREIESATALAKRLPLQAPATGPQPHQ